MTVRTDPTSASGPADRPVETPARAGAARTGMARSGALTLAGSVYAALAGFALTVLVGRWFGAELSGLYFMAVAVFMILNVVAMAGGDSGLVRSVAAYRATGAHEDAWTVSSAILAPMLAWSLVVAGGLAALSGPLAAVLTPDDAALGRSFLLVLSLTLVFSAVGQASVNGTRSLGGARTFVLLYQVWLPTGRLLLLGLLWLTDGPTALLLWTWTVPLVLMDLVAFGLLRRTLRRERLASGIAPRPRRQVLRDAWAFNLPRGLASLCEIGIKWADVLLVGLLLGPAAAGVWAAASRFVTTGIMAMEALRIVSAPLLASAFARGEEDEAADIHAMATTWLVLLSWPMFLTLAAFSPLVMSLVGPEFTAAAPALTVMCLGLLGYLALGNVNSMLLMAGLSRLTAANSVVSLGLNVSLGLVLIPTWGLPGAAVAWCLALTGDSVLCVLRRRGRVDVALPWAEVALAGGVALVAFGLPALAVTLLLGPTLVGLAVQVPVSLLLYAALLVPLRHRLHLGDVRALIGARR
ncbi:oligosaccharide flippase family protein [Nocardioides sp. CFH 31398]|uniref:MATE family efflux transporter n=1 Tax=Nocardioides sp. CFH 31398 TaxID=2919579 RepID=UPI001F055427|nr:oligosaccharide flippase family protein [Nocardioides sp. CFH 31398]MCH1865866.1 oligosaccharide flippase family protein [Nocardioides sp. CFH 31398]